MSFDKCPRFKDPFSTSPLPRSFYYPTPTKDVDTNVVIQSQERKDELSQKSSLEKPFKTGSSFKLASLPQLKNVNLRNQSYMNNVTNSDDGYNETWPKSELPSNSALMDTSQLTSSLDEADRNFSVVSLLHKQGNKSNNNAGGQDESTSVIQKYINRFRYSAPKSREERVKEISSKSNTFWWLHTDAAPSPEDPKASRTDPLQPSNNVHKQEKGIKLTREAVLELDKETSYLQQKADKILSISQLSLVSSGPCVSTDGLGSSTSALSECSYRTDPQPAYRPVFVNLQGELHPPAPRKEDYENIEEKQLSPDDVLARWRMRRKMDDAHHQDTHLTNKGRRPIRNHNEIDIRLEEFRKKLFAQRALITTEDIQFERQRMKILMDEDLQEKQQKVDLQINETESPPSHLPTEDPILSRLRQITKTDAQSYQRNCSRSHHDTVNSFHSDIHSENKLKNNNSSNVNTTNKEPNRIVSTSPDDHIALNTNNTALADCAHSNKLKNVTNYSVDEMKSISICEANQKSFSLNENSPPENGVRLRSHAPGNYPQNVAKDSIEHLHRQTESVTRIEHQILSDPDEEKRNQSENGKHHNGGFISEQNVLYHQRLQAEKPCGDSSDVNNDKTKREHHVEENGGSRLKSQQITEKNISVSGGNKPIGFCSSKDSKGQDEFPQKRRKSRRKDEESEMHVNNGELSDASSDNSKSSRLSKTKIDHRHKEDCSHSVTEASQTKLKSSAESVHRPSEVLDSGSVMSGHPRSSQQSKIQKVIGETVVDHLFDGPSMISSVDSWASLFPQSPMQSHSFHNSTTVTPTKDGPTFSTPTKDTLPRNGTTSTPQTDYRDVAQEKDDSNQDSICEFKDDPLMNLLLQQKKEYLHKLELIELKLQQLEDT